MRDGLAEAIKMLLGGSPLKFLLVERLLHVEMKRMLSEDASRAV